MEMNEFDYHFKVRTVRDVTLNLGVIYKNLGYIKIDKNKISKLFGLTEQDIEGDDYLHKIMSKVEMIYEKTHEQTTNICKQLQQKWEEYRDKYFIILKNIFDIDINRDIKMHTYCYLQMLPINEVDLKDNVIYLDCNKDIDDIISDLKIETVLKGKVSSIMFSDLDLKKKRIEIRKLNKKGVKTIKTVCFFLFILNWRIIYEK